MKSLRIKQLDIMRNEILKSNASAITIIDLCSYPLDPSTILIKNNTITDMKTGYGIYIENSSCQLESNFIQGVGLDGIHVTGGLSS